MRRLWTVIFIQSPHSLLFISFVCLLTFTCCSERQTVLMCAAESALQGEQIQGSYAASGLNLGKPVYRKIAQDGSNLQDAVICFLRHPNHSRMSWWLGPSLDCDRAYAFNESDSEAGVAPIPLLNWKVRPDWEVDDQLRISVVSSAGCCLQGDGKSQAVEVVWEFLASGDGHPEDWQPMSKEMQEILEKH